MPAENESLLDFIDALKNQGASDEFVVALLRQNGWSEKRIYQSFLAWYEARTGRAVPNGGGRIETAKDAFLYLLAFITLGIWSIQLGALLFLAIDRSVPNPVVDYLNSSAVTSSLANQLAAIIVAYPLFLLVSRAIVRGFERQPERLESPVRKWLTYIALVITAIVMIGDAVTFLAYLLRGDLDTRFVLKALTVLAIAGVVFGYYLDSLNRDKVSQARNRVFGLAATGLVLLGVVVGFVEIGSPREQRLIAADARRLSDLYALAEGLHTSWLTRRDNTFFLPPTIQEAARNRVDATTRTTDPLSNQAYSYMPMPGTTYRLCATFERPSPADTPTQWNHPAGNKCFVLDASQNVERVPGVFNMR